jgi:hypothetical protein
MGKPGVGIGSLALSMLLGRELKSTEATSADASLNHRLTALIPIGIISMA